MPASRETPPDQGRNAASLALECHIPAGEMVALCEHERARPARAARLTNALHIFATRNVLEILRERGLDRQPSKLAKPGVVAG